MINHKQIGNADFEMRMYASQRGIMCGSAMVMMMMVCVLQNLP